MNPYAPPAAPRESVARPGLAGGRTAAFLVLYPMASLIALGLDGAVFAGASVGMNGQIARIGASAIGLAWLYARWAALPREAQVVGGAHVGPWGAVLRHAVPIYGLYWIFTVQHALCGALNDALIEKERPANAPVVLATVAPALQVVFGFGMNALNQSLWFLVLAGTIAGAWTVYMVRVEMSAAGGRG